jgi:L-seryl-tRNA(Ser) seleniumtransferase
MKVSKEEIVGMCTAIELFSRERIDADYRTWESWLHTISESLNSVPGVTTKMSPPAVASPFPVLRVSWDPSRILLTGAEVHAQLLDGEPRIMSHAAGDATSFVIRPVAMRPEHPPIVARRMAEVFRKAPTSPKAPPAAPATDLTGAWDAAIEFFDPPKGNPSKLRGLHLGKSVQSRFTGSISGGRIKLQSTLPLEGMHIHYDFQGTVSGDTLSGDLSLGEFGMARFTARRI